MVEAGVGILAACLPSLTFLFRTPAAKDAYSKVRSLVGGSDNRTAPNPSRGDNGKSLELQTTDTASMFSKQTPSRNSPVQDEFTPRTERADVRESTSSSINLPILGSTEDMLEEELDDVASIRSAASYDSRGTSRRYGGSTHVNSIATDTTWRTRGFSVDDLEGGLAPPPVTHRMKGLHTIPLK